VSTLKRQGSRNSANIEIDDAFGISEVNPVRENKKRNSKEFDLLNFVGTKKRNSLPGNKGSNNKLKPKQNGALSQQRSNTMRGTNPISLFDDFDFTSGGSSESVAKSSNSRKADGGNRNGAANDFGNLFGDFSSDKSLSTHPEPSSPRKVDVKSVMQGAYQKSSPTQTAMRSKAKLKPKKNNIFDDLFD